MSRRPAPRPASAAFRAALGQVAPKTRLAAVQGVWTEVVGERIAAVAQPVSERDGMVTVACSDPIWMEELDLMQEHLCRSLCERLAGAPPQGLRFRLKDDRD
jgi:predicted nucleic acid-binding Zn ribbon protein